MYLTIIQKEKVSFYNEFEKLEYVKKIIKNKKNNNLLRRLDNRQNVHSMICEFAGGCKRENELLLYKVIDNKANTIMIQSKNHLKNDILDDFGYQKIRELDIENHYKNIVKNNNVLKFKATIAPTKSKNGHKYSINSKDERLIWVNKKFDLSGAKILNVFETEHEYIKFKHSKDEKFSFFNSYTYEGLLEVKDKDKFLKSIFKGIGRAKSYGAGLIVLSEFPH